MEFQVWGIRKSLDFIMNLPIWMPEMGNLIVCSSTQLEMIQFSNCSYINRRSRERPDLVKKSAKCHLAERIKQQQKWSQPYKKTPKNSLGISSFPSTTKQHVPIFYKSTGKQTCSCSLVLAMKHLLTLFFCCCLIGWVFCCYIFAQMLQFKTSSHHLSWLLNLLVLVATSL